MKKMIRDGSRVKLLFILGKAQAVGVGENAMRRHAALKKIDVAFTDIRKREYYQISKSAYLEALEGSVTTEEEAKKADKSQL